jgi:hypothetical protein
MATIYINIRKAQPAFNQMISDFSAKRSTRLHLRKRRETIYRQRERVRVCLHLL